MLIATRRVAATVLLSLAALAGVSAAAQTQTALDKQLSRLDLALLGIGQFSNTNHGTNNQKSSLTGEPLTTRPTRDFNGAGQISYTKSTWVGVQFNYIHGRNAYNFSTLALVPSGGATPLLVDIQTNADEYSFGYLAHPHPFRLVKPFVSAGAGVISFAPTAGGGEGYKQQARFTEFYSVGADVPITEHLGLRGEIRQKFYLHPDYETNYLRDLTRSETIEPAVGFYLRF
jgi:hypothetical protein